MLDLLPMKITIPYLRDHHPEWTWRAERSGWGWRYVGSLREHHVRISCCAVWSGPMEDDFSPEWWVYEESKATPYYLWKLKDLPCL